MNYKGIRVLVLDGYGRQIPTILRQLHELGCEITTVNDSKLDIGYTSRYPKNKILLKGVREDVKPLRAYLEKALLENKYDVIFPMLEKATDLLLTLGEEGKTKNVHVICAPREAFMKAYDKEATMKVCQENNIPCPITKMDEETLDEYLAKVQFPLACKPRKGSGAAGFKIAKSREQLEKFIKEGLKIEEYVIQEYISHSEYHYGAYLMFDKNSNPISNVVVTSCRQYPVDGGPGCYIRTVDDKDIKESTERLLQCLDWQGFGHVGLIRDPRDHKAKVMEINGRIPAGIKICNIVGYQTVKDLLDFAYGIKIKPFDIKIPEGIGLRHSQADVMWLIKSPNRFSAKPCWFNFHHNNDYVWDWADPLPFFSYSLQHVLTYKKDMAKRKH